MGIKSAGKQRTSSFPYSKQFTVGGSFPVDMTETTAAAPGTGVGSPSSGSRHGASGFFLYIIAAGTFTYKDAAGVTTALVFAAPPATGLLTPFIPATVSEITSFTGVANWCLAVWND